MRYKLLLAILGSVALHACVFALASNYRVWFSREPSPSKVEKIAIHLDVAPPAPAPPPKPTPRAQAPAVWPNQARKAVAVTTPATKRQPASQAAPPAPTAEEWAFASQYALKNGKGYRYEWGKQVRSMMGTAVEGADAGVVRFRLEIAPDGTLTRLETLWTTSIVAEQLARTAIKNMPTLPPTPSGKPLIFERTISFSPFATEWPPIYDDDCLPDPPAFTNPFAWDGKSPQVARNGPEPVNKLDRHALEECRKQLPQNSIEAESTRGQREQNQWRSINPGK